MEYNIIHKSLLRNATAVISGLDTLTDDEQQQNRGASGKAHPLSN